jgi:hypothetical protein
MDEIKKRQEDIQRLISDIEKIKDKRKRTLMLDQVNKLQFDQEARIMSYLKENDEYFKKTVTHNFELLENDNIVFNVWKYESNVFFPHFTQLQGEIHQNGYLYLVPKDLTSFYKDYVNSLFYPVQFCGTIDYIGQSHCIVSKKRLKFLSFRLPKKFKGSISFKGMVNFEVFESDFDLDGIAYIKNIIADPFSANETKRKRFINNRLKLKKLIDQFKKEI